MNSITILPLKVKIRKCHSYFSGFFIILEWHLCLVHKQFKATYHCRIKLAMKGPFPHLT